MNSLLNDNADIKMRLKNIELLTEINNDPDFSKDVINRVAKANIFPSIKDLVDETEHVIRKNFPDISESINSRHHSNLFKRIKAKLLEKLWGMRAIFEIFGESQLPRIDFQSSPAEINSWKSDQRVQHAYRKLFDIFFEDRTNVQDLVDETEHVIRKNFPDISESINSRHHSNLFKRIKAKLLEKLWGMRAIFEIFGESQLPRIDFQSSPAEINSWKSDQRVQHAYRKLFDIFFEDRTNVQVILERVWKSKKRISNMYIVWGVAIAQLFLNPDVKEIMISENLLKKQIKINFVKRELDAEETSEEESEKEEEEGKSPKRRKTSRGHVPSPGRAPSPGEGRQRAREVLQRSPEGEEEDNTTNGDTERAEIVEEQ
ncbi:hypothetical protein Glove_92g81 [Diversispora epigaea]|uniref:Uncharacterized protein n=1 Tax=Diversispora epigaea TaxID=1348612 RepID=A0A397JE23_9GLOM|nr:hypothetical protein Glove_92g81 [Diversispora epigaea]